MALCSQYHCAPHPLVHSSAGTSIFQSFSSAWAHTMLLTLILALLHGYPQKSMERTWSDMWVNGELHGPTPGWGSHSLHMAPRSCICQAFAVSVYLTCLTKINQEVTDWEYEDGWLIHSWLFTNLFLANQMFKKLSERGNHVLTWAPRTLLNSTYQSNSTYQGTWELQRGNFSQVFTPGSLPTLTTLTYAKNCTSSKWRSTCASHITPTAWAVDNCPVPQTTPVETVGKQYSVTRNKSFNPVKSFALIPVQFLNDVVLISST